VACDFFFGSATMVFLSATRRLLFALVLVIGCTFAIEKCSLEQGGGICPTGNTCCQRFDGSSGCIPNDLGSFNATCCDGYTGCPVGYLCGPNQNCVAKDEIIDPLVQILPRYRLCHSSQLARVHGLPDLREAKLAYYSSHGDITEFRNNDVIEMAVVVIHGAGRNADDYFCTVTAAVEQMQQNSSESILVIAPRFPVAADGEIELEEGGIAVRWSDDGSGGPWRFGANAVSPEYVENYSSYDAVDRLVAILNDKRYFLTLQHVAVIGHSSGGQFVQRWSLLTKQWDGRVRGVVANPSSYAYLAPQRFYKQRWQEPPLSECPDYNKWEWGLEDGGNYSVSYVREALDNLSLSSLIRRFAERQVIYMAGTQDVCDVSGQDPGWCYSHGLETTCMDRLEGCNRWERNLRYLSSLRLVGVSHERMIVPGVGHDHSFMFNSVQGLQAIFGGPESKAEEKQ